MKFSIKSQLKNLITGIVALSALFMTGCSMDATPGMGNLKVKLHDAPVNYEEVNIFIERVEINNTEGDDGWQVISEPNESFDILELTNGAFELLADVDLEEGFYPQIRLIVNADSNSVVIDGESYGLFIPSGAQTGVKLNVNVEIREGEEYTVMLDFDAERSVVKTGQAAFPGYLLKPVIRVSNEAETGNIGGVISPIEAMAVVYAIAGEDTLSTTYADEETGEFLLMSLTEGSYDVAIVPGEAGYESKRIEDIEVEKGETTDLGTIELDSE